MHIAIVKDKANIILFLVIIILFSSISAVVTSMAFMVTDKIYNGVMVGDIVVGGLSIKEAEDKIQTVVQQRLKEPPISLHYEDKNWVVNADEIDLVVDPTVLAHQAFNVGRRGNILQQMQERYITINGGYQVPFLPIYSSEKLQLIIGRIANEIDRPARSAEIELAGSQVNVVPDSKGRKVDVVQLIESLNQKLQEDIPVAIDIPVAEITPRVQTSDIAKIDSIIAMYTTQFDPMNKNRVQNISLAAKSITGILLRSGEVFSFNEIVGLRKEEYGYKEAPVFIEGKLVPDWGGGVCQVSSTLYNAALLADMNIEERTSHFRPPGYVPLGQDATVADHLLDFKFINTLPQSIYILSEVSRDSITIYILSQNNPNHPEISIVTSDKKVLEPNTIVKQDATLDFGKEVIDTYGQKGFIVSINRVKKVNGKEIGREYISTDEFKPEDRVVRVGTKAFSNQATK